MRASRVLTPPERNLGLALFKEQLVRQRKSDLQFFISLIENSKIADREDFKVALRIATTYLDVSNTEIAKRLDVSVATIGRWIEKENAPPGFQRNAVMLYVLEILKEKLKELDS